MKARSRWSRAARPGVHVHENGAKVFRIGVRGDVEDPTGRQWAAYGPHGDPVESRDMNLASREGLYRFATMAAAMTAAESFGAG